MGGLVWVEKQLHITETAARVPCRPRFFLASLCCAVARLCACRFVQECAKRGLLVMLDMHRLAAKNDIPELW